jgi:hypothetical protein
MVLIIFAAMEYLNLFRQLSFFRVKYLVCGGLAVNIYGIPRMTADIDLLIDFTDENVTNFENALKVLTYQSAIPVSIRNFVNKEAREIVIKEKNLIAFSYFNNQANYMSLDVLMDTPISFGELWSRKETRLVDKTPIDIVSVEDLIALKKYANRNQDIDDIILLSKLIKK